MIVSFLGTKGGTGTTTLAVNVAAEIRRLTDRPTVIVDLKTGPGDVSLFLGLRPRHTVLTAVDQLSWIDPGGMAKFVVEHGCGLHVLAGGEEYGRPAARDIDGIEQMLRRLGELYDFVILDAGNALTPCSAMALQSSETVVLVANPDVPCLRNLQRLIDAVKLGGVGSERLKILLNRASESGGLSASQIERVLGLTLDYTVNSDYRTVAASVNAGAPVSTIRVSDLTSQITAIARLLSGAGDSPAAANPALQERDIGGAAARRQR
jgi:pilus assembly protein CpaE